MERYQNAVAAEGRRLVKEYDKKMAEAGNYTLSVEANEEICKMAKKKTIDTLNKVLHDASIHMKNGYNRGDN